MSIVPTPEDRRREEEARRTDEFIRELINRQWNDAIRSKPDDRNYRCLCWIVTEDEMGYIGIRVWRSDVGEWYSNSVPESGRVTHWMALPEPPIITADDSITEQSE